ncbi:MAG: AIR synthase-related protein, partial [Planctomycetota bacterium]
NDGPSDAAIIQPIRPSGKGLIVACGLNPRYSDLDPYHMAANAIDEAARQVIAVGGSLERTAILDNFCWGNTDKPDRLGALVRAARACYDIAIVYGMPFISGKDSLNNEFQADGRTIVIPGTLLISAISVLEDVSLAITMDLKQPGNLLYLVGETRDELGGSMYYRVLGHIGKNVPTVDAKAGKATFDALSRAVRSRLARSCHDLSDGGLAVAAAEMAFAGELGAEFDLDAAPVAGESLSTASLLFSESPSRFIVEVEPGNREAFEKALAGVACGLVGRVTEGEQLLVTHGGRPAVRADVRRLKEAWQATLAW